MLTDVFGGVRVLVICYKALLQDIDLLFTVGHPTAPLVLDSCERECTRHVGKKGRGCRRTSIFSRLCSTCLSL